MLDIPQNDLRLRLSAESRLVQSGLLEANLRSGVRNHMSDLLGFNNKDLLFSVRHHQGSAIGLFQSAFRPAPESELEAKDFIHLDTPLKITRPYLQQALETKKPGLTSSSTAHPAPVRANSHACLRASYKLNSLKLPALIIVVIRLIGADACAP